MTIISELTAHPLFDPSIDDSKCITRWCPPSELVEHRFFECPKCATIKGYKHGRDCKRAPRRLAKVVHSCYGRVTYLEWCRAEQARLTVSGAKVSIVCHPIGATEEAAEYICLLREGK